MKIAHFHTDSPGNGGDQILSWSLRQVFNEFVDVEWDTYHVRTRCDNALVNKINQADLVVVGGGGLFLRDTGANPHSGWQWPMPLKLLAKIKTPLVLYGVGYNRFRNQEDFEPIFTDHINAVVEKARFVGLRNHGSINAVRNYLRPELHDKLIFQPCPSVHLDKLTDVKPVWLDGNTLYLNPARDRSAMRFGEKLEKDFFAEFERFGLHCKELGWNVKVVHNTPVEKGIKLNFPTVQAHGKRIKQLIDCYAKAAITVGMKGHGQMIPFGLGNAIISVISHDKLQWFLDDIRADWGIEAVSDVFEGLKHKLEWMTRDRKAISSQIQEAKIRFWHQTEDNMELILS